MINKELYIGTSTPKSNEVVWIRPLKDGGVSLYAYAYNKWQVLKLVDGKGTLPVDDDNVINLMPKEDILDALDTVTGLDAETIEQLKELLEQVGSLADKADGIAYDSTNKLIKLTSNGTTLASIDASDFIVDGMVESAEVKDVVISGETVKCLVITFNTDAGKNDVNIPITDFFDASKYYTKTLIDSIIGYDYITPTDTDSRYIGPLFMTTSWAAKGDSFRSNSLTSYSSMMITIGFVSATLIISGFGTRIYYGFNGGATYTDLSLGSSKKIVVTINNENGTTYYKAVDYDDADNVIFNLSSPNAVDRVNIGSNSYITVLCSDISVAVPKEKLIIPTVPTNVSAFANDAGYLTSHQDISGKQDTLVSGTNIKTVNSTSLLGSGDVSVGTITGITMNNVSKGQSGVVNLGTVLTTTTSNVTSGDTTPITSNGVYDALQRYETKLYFSTTSGTALAASRNNYYRFTNTPSSLSINLPTSSITAGDTCAFNFTTNSSFGRFTISGGTIKKMKDFAIEPGNVYEVIALFDGAKWLVTATEFK